MVGLKAFRTMLVVIFVTVFAYTVPVMLNHGLNLLPVFFGDIAKIAWTGQFNLDFLCMLLLSAFWVSWRNRFSKQGLLLGVLAFFFGAPFLTIYLLYLSFVHRGDAREMLCGARY